MSNDGSCHFLAHGLQLDIHSFDLNGNFLQASLLLLRIDSLLQVEQLSTLELQFLHSSGDLFLFFRAHSGVLSLLTLQSLDLTEDLRTQLQLGVCVQLVPCILDGTLLGCTVGSDGISQFLIVEDNGAFIDEAVGLQHTGKGLGEDGLTGTGFANDGNGFIFIEIHGNAANGGQDSSTDTEFNMQVFDRQ